MWCHCVMSTQWQNRLPTHFSKLIPMFNQLTTELYLKSTGKPLEGFKQMEDMIQFIFSKYHFICYRENGNWIFKLLSRDPERWQDLGWRGRQRGRCVSIHWIIGTLGDDHNVQWENVVLLARKSFKAVVVWTWRWRNIVLEELLGNEEDMYITSWLGSW